MSKLLRVPAIARVLDVSQAPIRRMIRDGRLPAVRVGKRSLRVEEQQLNKWIENGGTFERPSGTVPLESAEISRSKLLGIDAGQRAATECFGDRVQIGGIVGEGPDRSMHLAITCAAARAAGIALDKIG
jgi:excisionase family DNA binding protein